MRENGREMLYIQDKINVLIYGVLYSAYSVKVNKFDSIFKKVFCGQTRHNLVELRFEE